MIRRLSDFAALLALAAVLAAAWALTRERPPAPVSPVLRAGFDTGFRAIPLLAATDEAGVVPMQGWMRIRGVPERRSTVAERTQTRAALRDLRERGVRSLAFFTAAGYPWTSGVRQLTGSKGTVPLDLREAYERGRWLGRRYGAFVDAWEVDNEPDMVYVRDNPENYAAYLKAMYWGLKRGAFETQFKSKVEVEEALSAQPSAVSSPSTVHRPPSDVSPQVSASDSWNLALAPWHLPHAPRVVMAPMALPPGPYFEALLDNDLLSYTEGFNFHYYGFEEDFPGLYAQYREAVTAVSDKLKAESAEAVSGKLEAVSDGAAAPSPRSQQSAVSPQVSGLRPQSPVHRLPSAVDRFQSAPPITHSPSPITPRSQLPASRFPLTAYRSVRLPIFISEYGNGLLSGRAATTTAGRVRQWRDHRALAGHMRALRIEAPMAFYLRPYLEDEAREYGLTIAPMKAGEAVSDKRKAESAVGSALAAGPQNGPSTSDGPTKRGDEAVSGKRKAESSQVSGLGLQLSAVSSQQSALSPQASAADNRVAGAPRYAGGPSGPALPQAETAPPQVSGLRPQVSAVPPQVSGLGLQPSALRAPQFSAGGLTFTPQDFGCDEPEPWMADIGRPIGGAEASPALAWMLNQPPLPEPEAWEVVVPEPSPVVLDFVAGEGLRQSKTMRGHQLTTRVGERLTGRGTVWVYNFASRPVAGAMRLEGHGGAAVEQRLTLKPGERRAVPVEFAVSAERFHGVQWRARFEADDGSVPSSRLASWIYPHVGQFVTQVLVDLQHAAPAAAQNAARIDARPLARGEAPLFPQGRWRVTKGVTVEERGDTWRFTVTEFPDEVMRPAMAELPLPDGFRFPRYSMILAQLRLAPRRAEEVRAHPEPRGEPENSALDREVFGVYFRTAQGGLYVTTMNFAATTEWLNFGQVADNFTPFFYGRIHLPWRFLENEPAALALVFRPRLLPATYEVRGARIVELIAPSAKR